MISLIRLRKLCRKRAGVSRWLPLQSKTAERLFRLYMVTIALDAGKFKQLLARKGTQRWRMSGEFSRILLAFMATNKQG